MPVCATCRAWRTEGDRRHAARRESALLDTTLQALELLRDVSHVRNYRASEWRSMLNLPGPTNAVSHSWKLPIDFDSWVRRIATPARRVEALRAVLADLPAEARDHFAIAADASFISDALWIEVARRG
jgi:hypothetical protein